MADIQTQIGEVFSGVNFGVGGINPLAFISLLIFGVVFLVFCGFATYLIVLHFKYKYKIVIWEDINGEPKVTGRDSARDEKLENGSMGFFLRKRKLPIVKGNLQSGRRLYWYYVRPDGVYENVNVVTLSNYYQSQLRDDMLKNIPSKGMQYANNELRLNNKERFNKVNWIDKYLGIIVYTSLIIFTGLMMWLLFREWLGLANIVTQTVELSNQAVERSTELLNAMDNICADPSGRIVLSQ
jgi:hypothetical protein